MPSPAAQPGVRCPATLVPVQPNDVAGGSSVTFAYFVQTGQPQHVTAMIVADTDGGWYGWTASGIETAAPAQKYTVLVGGRKYSRDSPVSAPLTATFSKPLRVRHAWISKLGGSAGEWVDCQVPAFKDRDSGDRVTILDSAPSARDDAATPVAPPFADLDCATPFRPPAVTRAVAADFPSSEIGNSANVSVLITVDGSGRLMNSSIYQSSDSVPFDAAALRSARESSYQGAISYCQPITTDYLFTATFH